MTYLRLKYNLGKYEEEDSEKLVEGFSEKNLRSPYKSEMLGHCSPKFDILPQFIGHNLFPINNITIKDFIHFRN